MRVFVDTNFLLIPFQFNLDIFSELDRLLPGSYELIVSSLTIKELNNIIKNKRSSAKDKRAAKMAKQVIERKSLKKIIVSEYEMVDDFLIEHASEFEYVATQDKELKKKLKNKTKLIVMKAGKYLAIG